MAAQCFNRWLHLGVWERPLGLAQEQGGGASLGVAFLDGSSVQAHRCAAAPPPPGPRLPAPARSPASAASRLRAASRRSPAAPSPVHVIATAAVPPSPNRAGEERIMAMGARGQTRGNAQGRWYQSNCAPEIRTSRSQRGVSSRMRAASAAGLSLAATV